MKYTIEQYENMPYRSSIWDFIPRQGKASANKRYRRRDYRDYTLGDYNVYQITQRVIENNIGKSFSMAFSYFCTLVPKYLQYKFLEEFEYNSRYMISYAKYYIDTKGNIQKFLEEEPKKIYKIQIKPDVIEYKIKRYHWFGSEEKWVNIIPTYFPSSWIIKTRVVEDGCIYFESKNDPRFKRIMGERTKAFKKKAKKIKPNIEDFRHILRAKQLKEKEETRLKLEAKGFRKNAFTNNKTDL